MKATESWLADHLPSWLVQKVPRDHRETDAAFRRRRKVVTGVSVLGAGLLGISLSSKPGSPRFYAAGLSVAAVYVAGGLDSGPLHLGYEQGPDQNLKRPVLVPVLTGLGAFGAFYSAALVARRIPVLDRALRSVLMYADQGDPALVYLTTLANGVAEEVFFRGALYAALGTNRPVVRSTAIYTLATTPTRNPALVLAAGVMGSLFALQRRASGGIQAPILTHVTWSALMAHFLPPLFSPRATPADRPDR